MTALEKIQMEFECSQDWESMQPVACGRFCSQCNKVVHDLRDKSYDEIKQIREQERTCGIFLPEQVESGLIPAEVKGFQRIRLWIAAAVTIAGLEMGPVYAQTAKPDTVLVIDAGLVPVIIPDQSELEQENSYSSEENANAENTPQYATKRRSKFYFSKRFPFIHKRRKRTYLIGCPSF